MKKILILLPLTILACQNPNPQEQVEITQTQEAAKVISPNDKTVFLPTMEFQIPEGKNAVYCATLLLAWDEISQILGAPTTVSKSDSLLYLFNESRSFKDALKAEEYTKKISESDSGTHVEVHFFKELPFAEKLTDFGHDLTFDNTSVEAFGEYGAPWGSSPTTKILYYDNDNHFAVMLVPKNKKHEVLLYMPTEKFNSLGEAYQTFKNLRKRGTEEKNQKPTMFEFNTDDILKVPKINFRMKQNFEYLEGKEFMVGMKLRRLITAQQMNALTLDETGAIIESEAEIAEALEELPGESTPKKLIFDKPFYLFLKRTDADNPYLIMWVENAELMLTK